MLGDVDPQDLTQTIELVKRAQSGDGDALDRLMRRYYPRVLKIVRLRMGARLRRSLESRDVLQETFAKAVRLFERFEMRDEGALINWLARIAEHELMNAADHFGAQKRSVEREVELDQAGVSSAVPAPAEAEPLAGLIESEETQLVEQCLARLPEHYRELILLRNYAGLAFAEIARETGRPSENAARMMYVQALVEITRLVRAASRTGS
jgi:RNA polymerase sigma-70 factor (ECF subfamily)